MNSYTLHITLYDLFFFGMIFTGLNFALLLTFVKSINRGANRLLALALLTMILWMIRILAIDIRLQTYLPGWDLLPMQFLLALGPLMYFYVLKIMRPEYQFTRKDLLHFIPVVLEQVVLLNPVLQLLIFISIITYLYRADKLIQKFYRGSQPVLMDRPLLEFRWLHRLLAATAMLWFLWIAYAVVDYFGYSNQLGIHVYYPFYIFFAVITIWTAMAAFLRPQAGVIVKHDPFRKPLPPTELGEKGTWLKKAMEANLYHQDPRLSLSSLAEKLELTTHELSRIINTALKKSFNDFINEYRVRDVILKMQDPAYDHITLLGIAFESGFNSKTTFNRTFRQLTGKSPIAYKALLKKERPSYNLGRHPRFQPLILNRTTTPVWSYEKLNGNYMFGNYLKIATRNLMKNKVYSFINITGLAVGMASAILIFLWIQNEVSHDRFHTKIDRLYLMNNRAQFDGEWAAWNNMPVPMGPAIKKGYPEVEDAVRVNRYNANFLISNGDKHFDIHGAFVDTGFLNMFSFPLLEGNPDKALSNIKNIVLTQQLAKKLFGNDDAMGKTVKVDSADYLTVTGVLKDLPNNTFFEFEYLLPWAYATKAGKDDNSWSNNGVQIFVSLKAGSSPEAFDKKVSNITIDHLKKGETTVHVFAQPFKDAWLYSKQENGKYVGGRIDQVRLFIIIAVFILLIACINFTNLSTARSEKRAKEVGIRKVAGARRHALIMQFISESILLALVAGIIAVTLVVLVLPAFSNLIGKKLFIDFSNPLYWLYAIVFIVFTGIMAGIYPAFYLSSFQPAKVLKGTFRQVNALVTPRKILVVLQFTFAIALIICTIIVEGQIKYAQSRAAGYSRNNLAFVEISGDMNKNYSLIKHDLLGSGAATAVAETSAPMTEHWNDGGGFTWDGSMEADKKTGFIIFSADNDFSRTMGLKILQGREIDMQHYKTDSTAVLLNETAVKRMRLKDPVGKLITGAHYSLHVVGVVQDFILESPYSPVAPMMIAGPSVKYNVINFRLNPGPSIAVSLGKAEKVFKQYNPDYPFNGRFYALEYAKKFEDELRAGTLAGLFAGLTIFISCLGLFGLATYMAQSRIKEIGIRKVLGANVTNITALLSKEFLKLVTLSFIIASPVAWTVMHQWLLNYDYRIAIQWWVFAGVGILTFVIAIATVSFQAIRAAVANPVKSLRSE